MNLGKVTRIFIIGGGQSCADLVEIASSYKIEVMVLTSPRHAAEKLDFGSGKSMNFEEVLVKSEVKYLISSEFEPKEITDFFGELQNTFFISLGAAWIFKESHLQGFFQNKLFNLHGTRLPHFRGGGGFSWQILTRNRFGYITLHLVDSGIDTGPIVLQREFLYPSNCRLPIEFEKHFGLERRSFFKELCNSILTSDFILTLNHQQEYFSTYWPRLNTKINSWIDWGNSPYELEAFICAFDDPYPGAQTYLHETKVFIKKVSINLQDGLFHPYQAGIIYRVSKNWICVSLNSGAIIIETVLDEKGNDLKGVIRPGDRFTTSPELLANSKIRTHYGPE